MGSRKQRPTPFQTVLAELANAFEAFKRNGSDDRIYKIKDSAPQWLQGSSVMLAIHQAIDDRSPDDWVYDMTHSIASTMEGYSTDSADGMRDNVHEIADGLVDIYTSDRTAWLASHLANVQLVDDACNELGCEGSDITDRIGVGQYYALERIANAVIDACEVEAEARKEAFAERIADIAVEVSK